VIRADILLKQQIQRVEPNRRMNEVLLLQDNARPHTSLRTKEATATMGWIVLPHPTYSPDLAPCNFHLFDPLKDSLQGHCFAGSNELEHSVCEEL
jgi:histone-lysine N-methyltransferase SETMAR